MQLSAHEQAILAGETGTKGAEMALNIVVQAARMMGASRLVPITSAHIDGVLFHGPAGVEFVEELARRGAQVQVPTTTNVGALNLLKRGQSNLSGEDKKRAFRQMVAHEKMGCRPSWTCAPYQAGARPGLGQQIAWGESNAVAFANSVLGARTNRYGDFLDIACAVSGRAPYGGLHLTENRRATLVFDVRGLPVAVTRDETFFPVLGTLIGQKAGNGVPAITGLARGATEDQLKALLAGAAATGAVGLCHVVGTTPEAPDLATATGRRSVPTLTVSLPMLRAARYALTASSGDHLDCIALGSPHFSEQECQALLQLSGNTPFKLPVYVCTGRHVTKALQATDAYDRLGRLGVEFVVDTCVAVTPILPRTGGTMMTNSAKFAHYALGTTGHQPVFGSLADCVASAQSGYLRREGGIW